MDHQRGSLQALHRWESGRPRLISVCHETPWARNLFMMCFSHGPICREKMPKCLGSLRKCAGRLMSQTWHLVFSHPSHRPCYPTLAPMSLETRDNYIHAKTHHLFQRHPTLRIPHILISCSSNPLKNYANWSRRPWGESHCVELLCMEDEWLVHPVLIGAEFELKEKQSINWKK